MKQVAEIELDQKESGGSDLSGSKRSPSSLHVHYDCFQNPHEGTTGHSTFEQGDVDTKSRDVKTWHHYHSVLAFLPPKDSPQCGY